MFWLLFLFKVVMFILLVPGVVVTLPPRSSRGVVLLTHGIIFAILMTLLWQPVSRLTQSVSVPGLMRFSQDDKKTRKMA